MLAIKTIFPDTVVTRHSVRLMGSQFEISVAASSPMWAEDRIEDAITEISRVEKMLSTFADDSIVNEINRNAGIKPVKTTGEFFRLVDRAVQVSALTYGVFDITYAAAGREGEEADADDTTIKAPAKKINYKSIGLNAKAQTVFLKEKGMRIGFGAISKGYAADRAKYILQLGGVSSGVINAGGDLLTWGMQPGNQPWTVADADPSQRSQPFADTPIGNMAMATSVNSEKYAAINNRKIPGAVCQQKGFPVSKIKSVSVISTTAELAGVMSTPVMSMGINASLYLINQLNQIACIVIDDHDRVYTSKDFSIS